jgi:hypothetical protein
MKRPRNIRQVSLLCSGLLVIAATGALIATLHGGQARASDTPRAKAVQVSLRAGANPTNIPRDRLLAMGLVPDQIRQVGAFGATGKQHELYLGPMTDGTMCLIEDEQLGTTPDGRPLRVYGRACSPGLLKDHAVVISISSAGGGSVPEGAESIVGVARPDVDSVVLEDSAGAIHPVPLNSSHAFEFAAPDGVRLAAVVAYSTSGVEIERRLLNTSN